jgi:hypothetical protein
MPTAKLDRQSRTSVASLKTSLIDAFTLGNENDWRSGELISQYLRAARKEGKEYTFADVRRLIISGAGIDISIRRVECLALLWDNFGAQFSDNDLGQVYELFNYAYTLYRQRDARTAQRNAIAKLGEVLPGHFSRFTTSNDREAVMARTKAMILKSFSTNDRKAIIGGQRMQRILSNIEGLKRDCVNGRGGLSVSDWQGFAEQIGDILVGCNNEIGKATRKKK